MKIQPVIVAPLNMEDRVVRKYVINIVAYIRWTKIRRKIIIVTQ